MNNQNRNKGTNRPGENDGAANSSNQMAKSYVKSAILIDPDHLPVTEGVIMSRDSEVEIVGIRFKPAGRVYYFYANGISCAEGDNAIVDTARGLEFGIVSLANTVMPLTKLVLPLRKVLRVATAADIQRNEDNARKRTEAYRICQTKIAEHKIDMKLVDVEYTFDNAKLLFYFTADGRVDFRDLVKDLAGVFRTRIELRQIGIRDEAKLIGGLGICGRPLCCSSFLSDFTQVSIKMAKEQNLSLNSAKISGTCDRLMCCLRYEYDVYSEEVKKTPRVDALVSTPDGEGYVIETTPLAGLVRVRFLGEKRDTPPKVFHRDDITVLKNKRDRRSENEGNGKNGAKADRNEKKADRNDKNNDVEKNDINERNKKTGKVNRNDKTAAPAPTVGDTNDEKAVRAEKNERSEKGERFIGRGAKARDRRGNRKNSGRQADNAVNAQTNPTAKPVTAPQMKQADNEPSQPTQAPTAAENTALKTDRQINHAE